MLKLTHHPQRQEADCLAACAWMVLTKLGVTIRYDRLHKLLKIIDEVGASIYNLRYLADFDKSLSVEIADRDMDWLALAIQNGIPVIVSVDTIDLPYWRGEAAYHAVVVVDIDGASVWLHDPWFNDAPKRVEQNNFESAWLRNEYACAVIQRS